MRPSCARAGRGQHGDRQPAEYTPLTALRLALANDTDYGLSGELGPDAVAAFTETKNVFIAAEE
jgi:hypothetical protein